MKLVHLAIFASFATLLLAGACTAKRVEYTTTVVMPAVEDFHGSVWKSRDARTEEYRFFKLRADGQFGFNPHRPGDFTFRGNDLWKLDDGMLIITHDHGRIVEKYPLDRTGLAVVLRGRKLHEGQELDNLVILTRIR